MKISASKLLLVVLVAAARAVAAPPNFELLSEAVVFVKRLGAIPAAGSGFFVSSNGLIYTSRRIVRQSGDLSTQALVLVPTHGSEAFEQYLADVVYTSPIEDPFDLAVLKIVPRPNTSFPFIPLRRTPAELGEDVSVIGYSFIFDPQPELGLSRGSISATRVLESGQPYLQTDAALDLGHLGAPMLDATGSVIGIVSWLRRDVERMSYGIPIVRVLPFETTIARTQPNASRSVVGPGAFQTTRILPTVQNWTINQGNFAEGPGKFRLDLTGGEYWVTSKQTLPENFQLVIPFRIEFMKPSRPLFETQRPLMRSLFVRWASSDPANSIAAGGGYSLSFSHSMMTLTKGEYTNRLAVVERGNVEQPSSLVITKRGGLITVAYLDEVYLSYVDPQPLKGQAIFSIGGFLSMLAVAEVKVTDMGP